MRDRAGMYGANVRRWRFQVTSYAAPCAKAATKTDLRIRRQNESRLVAAHHMSQGKLRLRTASNACMLRSATVNRPNSDTCNKIRGLVSGAHGASEDIGSSGLRFRAEVGRQCSD